MIVKIWDERGMYPSNLDAAIAEQDAYYGRDDLMNLVSMADEEARGSVIDGYSGYHNRSQPDSNGYDFFEVYLRSGKWYWSACDHNGLHAGFESVPYPSSKDAYYAGREGKE